MKVALVAVCILLWLGLAFLVGAGFAWAVPGPGGYAAWRVGFITMLCLGIVGLTLLALILGDELG